MRVSKKSINKNLQKEMAGIFFQLIVDIQNPQEAKTIFESLLSPVEVEAIAKRLSVAHYLDKSRSYQNIKDNLGVSSATIASIDKDRYSTGYRMALKKIEADHWANKWSEKLESLLKS